MSTLPSTQTLRERVDTAQVLTRFHFISRAVALACGGWIAATPRLDTKAALARAAWQQTLAGDAFRERVFELRYPNRFLEEGADAPLIRVVEAAIDAPGADAFLAGVAEEVLPDYARRLAAFLAETDELDDGPTVRIVRQALADVEEQQGALGHAPRGTRPGVLTPGHGPPRCTRRWRRSCPRPARRSASPSSRGATTRTSRRASTGPTRSCRAIPYGEGVALQVRSAVSHLNEVWAVDTAGAILHGLAPELGWEWIRDAGRWTYDEARHMLMGKRRLEAWGLPAGHIPLGGYIYEACAGQDPLYRLGMLGYFETKNIGRKRERAAAFHAMGDTTSETDMEFDWADETLHAEYGRRWLKELLERRGEDAEGWPEVLERCEQLVAARVAQATSEERARIVAAADALVADATQRAAGSD